MASLNLKTKVKSFFSGLQRERTHEDESLEEEIHALQPPDLPHAREDLRKTEEVIADIERPYFTGDEDCPKFELENLEEEVTIRALEDRIFTLKTQDNAIYRQIYGLVSDNYHAYVRELENVTMLEESLKDAARTCIGARLQLKLAREGVSHGGLGLLAKHRKRERLHALLDILRTLKTLQRTDARLKELLNEGDFPAATQLCLECQDAIETYKHFTCVRELAGSLQDVQNEIERELECALGKMCSHFNQYKYEQIQEAYGILGKTQTAVDTLLMRFTTSIHDSAYTVVADYAKRNNSITDEESQLKKTSYANLCKMVDVEDFIPCLKQICLAMWKVMGTYHQIKSTHEKADEMADKREANGTNEEDTDTRFNRNYVKTKLDNGLLRVWRDVQQKVRPYILGIDMSMFKYDNFIRVLDIVNRLIALGVEFCGEGSTSLQESMRQQSLMYFKNYHRARIDELRIFLEVEAWEVCPVRSTFTIHNLREFRFLHGVSTSSMDSPTKIFSPTRKDDSSIFSRFATDENPFDEQEEEEEEEVIEFGGTDDVVSEDEKNIEEDEGAGLKSKYEDENSKYFHHRSSSSVRGPLLANTTLTVLRFFGNYIQMMNVLHTIGFDVLECLSQLYDYYLYAIHQFFAVDLMDSADVQLSSKLTTSLKRIADTLILPQQENEMSVVQMPDGGIKVPSPSLNPVVDLHSSMNLYGLQHRMVAVQSLVFLASQFEYLVTYIEKLIPESNTKSFLSQFLFQTVKTSRELSKPVYYGIASRAIPTDQVLLLMGSVKWDIKEIRSQHSNYVDRLLQEFNYFSKRISIVEKSVHIPSEVSGMLWERAIALSNRMFVEGFSQAKKCSNEGRALMQLDFQQYRTQLEKMSHIRPLPTHGFVEDYIKAYYLSEEDTEDWIRQHQEYSAKQLQVLVTVGVGSRINKRSRQKLLAVIDELDKTR